MTLKRFCALLLALSAPLAFLVACYSAQKVGGFVGHLAAPFLATAIVVLLLILGEHIAEILGI